MNRVEVPKKSGSYRWYYVDVSAGDVSAVFIFMVGSVFSARYAAALKRGALPHEHAAVNFALYERGVRSAWVLSEYQGLSLEDEGRTLRIGRSSMRYDDDGLTMVVKDQSTPWGGPVEATLKLTPEAPAGPLVQLVEAKNHFWQPICARAAAHLYVASHGLEVRGQGYHDGNHGDVPLGFDLAGWEWTRTHHQNSTEIDYRPWGGVPSTSVMVTQGEVRVVRKSAPEPGAPAGSKRISGWGLRVPAELGLGSAPQLLESSPFYARLESRAGEKHALGEVAHFERFHSPTIRWMANFRTRYGKNAGGL